MDGRWVYEEVDHTDGFGIFYTTQQEIFTFTSETDCKREHIWKNLIHNTCQTYDFTHEFDGEYGSLTDVLFYYRDVQTLPFRYDSIYQTLTVWTDFNIGHPRTKHYIFHRK